MERAFPLVVATIIAVATAFDLVNATRGMGLSPNWQLAIQTVYAWISGGVFWLGWYCWLEDKDE